MANVKFFIKGKSNPTSIHVRFYHSKDFDFSVSTKLIINPNCWSKPLQKVKNQVDANNKDLINSILPKLKAHIIAKYNIDVSQGIYISKDWFKLQVAKFFNRPTKKDEESKVFFSAYIENFIEKAPKRFVRKNSSPVSRRTIQKYETTLKRLESFEKENGYKLKFQDIDLKFHKEFTDYLRNNLSYGENTIGKYIGTIKTFCHEANADGFPINPQYKHTNFYVPSEKTQDTYLDKVEINKIYQYDFSASDRLDNARDLFIIGLWTGLRISDFMKLETLNIQNEFFEITTQKTDTGVLIPIHDQIKQILSKRNGRLPRKISDVKFNLYIKEICKLVGINQKISGSVMNPKTKRKEKGIYPKYKLVSSHTCRRSFASNLYGKLPNLDIMAITGHATETQFLKYIKITPKQHAERLKAFWEKEKLLADEQKSKPKFQVIRTAN